MMRCKDFLAVVVEMAASAATMWVLETKGPIMSKRILLAAAAVAVLSSGAASQAEDVTSSRLKVSGATLYYEVRGSGPMLLMIPGGATDAGIFADLARALAGHYTVVTYDPRGNSRSALDGMPEDLRLDEQGDDAARLIETLGPGPAFVFGSSGGAQIGLNLAARHPERVRVLVAHEPPCLMMLADPAQALADDHRIYDTYRRDGAGAAMQAFMAMSGMDGGPGAKDAGSPPPPPPTAEAGATFARINGNLGYFFGHGLLPLSLFRPDVGILRQGQPRIVIGVGEQSAGQVTYRTGVALAGKLGVRPVLFPGDHLGYLAHADAFAGALNKALTDGKGS